MTLITICDTCKRDDWTEQSQTDGEKLAEFIEAAAGDIQTRRVSCLMGCERSCNVALQAEGKLTYVLGKFEATQDAAEGIVEYARLHRDSKTGQVPFRSWPQAVKGHFVSRIPPIETK